MLELVSEVGGASAAPAARAKLAKAAFSQMLQVGSGDDATASD